MKVIVPNNRKAYVLSFCRSVVLGIKPIYVEHSPLRGKPLKECFSIVPEHIISNGGKQKFGWAVFELNKIWLEAEFHVVWETEKGELFDLTPREISLSKILFIPDAKRNYEGVQVKSIFRSISKKPSVKKFIALSAEYYRALNEGDLANVQSGYVVCPKAAAIENEMDEVMNQIIAEHS